MTNITSSASTLTASATNNPLGGTIVKSSKIDPITAVQDSIDSLSLSLFEALRGLRDAAAPESAFQVQTTQSDPAFTDGVTPPATSYNTNESPTRPTVLNRDPDYEDFLLAYHHKEPLALDLISKAGEKVPKSREEYIKCRAKVQKEKDQSLVSKLSKDILDKSHDISDLVANLPGMHRTKAQQMERISELLNENKCLEQELKDVHQEATMKRDLIRNMLLQVTCSALGIAEEDD